MHPPKVPRGATQRPYGKREVEEEEEEGDEKETTTESEEFDSPPTRRRKKRKTASSTTARPSYYSVAAGRWRPAMIPVLWVRLAHDLWFPGNGALSAAHADIIARIHFQSKKLILQGIIWGNKVTKIAIALRHTTFFHMNFRSNVVTTTVGISSTDIRMFEMRERWKPSPFPLAKMSLDIAFQTPSRAILMPYPGTISIMEKMKRSFPHLPICVFEGGGEPEGEMMGESEERKGESEEGKGESEEVREPPEQLNTVKEKKEEEEEEGQQQQQQQQQQQNCLQAQDSSLSVFSDMPNSFSTLDWPGIPELTDLHVALPEWIHDRDRGRDPPHM